jgi:hypothetical protein
MWASLKEPLAKAEKVAGYFSTLKQIYEIHQAILQFFDIAEYESPELSAINALSLKLDQIESNLIWYINAIDSADHVSAIMGDLRAARQQLQQSMADPNNQALKFTTASSAFVLSSEHVTVLEDDHHFLRKYRPLSQDIVNVIPPSDLEAANPISIAEDPAGQWAYDWRAQLPRMVAGIVARVAILAAADPGFALSTVRDEIDAHNAALASHYFKMYAGVKCNYKDTLYQPGSFPDSGFVTVMCVDIHSQQLFKLNLPHGDINYDRLSCRMCTPSGGGGAICVDNPSCLAAVEAEWAAYWDNVTRTLWELHVQLLQRMPFYEIRALMNTLYTYTHPAPDLTEMQHRVQLMAAGDLCLDVQWGNSASGTPVWMWPCTASIAQRWRYDRVTENIVNTTMNKCLDVAADVQTLPQIVPLADRLRPFVNDCNGSASQRWSYDTNQNVLYSGANGTTVLRTAGAQQELPYLDWKDETPGSWWGFGGDRPYWRADTVNPCASQAPISRNVDVCADEICNVDPYCCDTYWDGICVSEVGSVCGQSCP